MAQGTQRREATKDSLAGAAEIQPVLPQAPQLQIPNTRVPNVVDNMSSKIAQSLSKWSSSTFQAIADKEHEKSILNGQTAFQQGKAMEDLDVPGDKFAMQAYRVMDAQVQASSFLTAQQSWITQSGYEKDPEEFRAIYSNRFEGMVEGLDSGTTRMLREQMATHMPTLVAQHTQAYMKNEEQNAFNALARSVDALSKDPTSAQDLLSNALGGEGSASAGLSQDRTRAAVIKGTVDSFANGNPLAYTQLKSAGLLDDLPVAEKQQLDQAKNAYENNLRTTINEEFTVSLSELSDTINAGDLTGDEAIEATIALYAEHDITASQAEIGAAYAAASDATSLDAVTEVLALQTAQTNGDYAKVASISFGAIQSHAAGDDTANGDIGNVHVTSGGGQAEWTSLIVEHGGNIEAAALAYGFSPEEAANVLKSVNGEDLYQSSENKFAVGKSRLATAQQMKKAIAVQQQQQVSDDAKQAVIDNTHLYRQALQPFTTRLHAGTMTPTEYKEASQGLLDILKLDMTASLSSAQADNVRTGINRAMTRATKLQKEAKTANEKLAADDQAQRLALFGMQATGLEVALKEVLVTPDMTPEMAVQHTDAYMNTVAELAKKLGIEVQDSGWNAKIKLAGAEVAKVKIASLTYQTEQAAIDNAANNGTVDELTPKLQKRVFKQKQAENEVMVSDAVASGAIDEDQAALAMQQANAATYIKLGKYSDDIKSQATAVMSREYSTDGVPNPQAIAVLTQWNEMRQDHPEVARTMFDEASEIKAQAIVELAGGNFASEDELAAALIASQRVMDTNAGLLTNSYIVDQGRITREVAGSVTSFLSSQDIGWIQGMWSPDSEMSQRYDRLESDEQRIFSDKAEERLNGAVMKEAFRLEKLSPNQTADFYAKMASDNVLGRAAVIGDEVVIMDRGHSVLSQMFGDSASSMDKDGVEQEVILHAIRGLIESDPDLAWMGEATSREHDDFLLRGLWHTGDAIASMWGGSVNTPTLSEEDAERIDSRGVRPFVVDVADGKTVGIRMRYPNGSLGGYLDIDLPTAGAAYRADFLAGLVK